MIYNSNMKALDFIKNVPDSGAIYLTGDDGYLKDAVISAVKAKVPDYCTEFNIKSVYGFKSPTELEDSLASMSPFGGTEVVLAGGYLKKPATGKAPKNDKDTEAFSRIVKLATDGVLLVVYDSVLTQAQAKLFVTVDCGRLDAQTLRDYVPRLAKPVKIDYRAVNMLIDYCNRDLGRISVELKKLSAYSDGEPVTAETVELLVPNMLENEVFELSNAFAEKNKKRATDLIGRFTARGISYSNLLALMLNQYRRLMHCALSPKSDKELAEIMGIKEYAVKKSRELASGYSKSALKNIFDLLVKAETDFKSGIMSEETAVKTAFAKLLTM